MSGPDISASEIAAVAAVINSGCLSIGPQIEAVRAAGPGIDRQPGMPSRSSSVRRALHLAVIGGRRRRRRPGDRHLVLVRRLGELHPLRTRHSGVRRRRSGDRQHRSGAGRRGGAGLQAGGAARDRWLPPAPGMEPAGPGTLKRRSCRCTPSGTRRHGWHRRRRRGARRAAHRGCVRGDRRGVSGRPAGTLGDAGVFAFYPNKQVTTGEGGMIVTDARRVGRACSVAAQPGTRRHSTAGSSTTRLGYNYRLDELSAALGARRSARLAELLARRERVAAGYTGAAVGRTRRDAALPSSTARPHVLVRLRRAARPGSGSRGLIPELGERGIPARPYFPPIHLQPFYVAQFGYTDAAISRSRKRSATRVSRCRSPAPCARSRWTVCVPELTAAVLRHGRGRIRDLTRTA